MMNATATRLRFMVNAGFAAMLLAALPSLTEAQTPSLSLVEGSEVKIVPITDEQRLAGRSEATRWYLGVNAPEGNSWSIYLEHRGYRGNSRPDTLFVEAGDDNSVGEAVFPSEIFNGGQGTVGRIATGVGPQTIELFYSVATAELPPGTAYYENQPNLYIHDEVTNDIGSVTLELMYGTYATGTPRIIHLPTPIVDLGIATESDFLAGALPEEHFTIDVTPIHGGMRLFTGIWDVYPNPIPGRVLYKMVYPMSSFEELARNRASNQGSLAYSSPFTLDFYLIKELDWENDAPGTYASQLRFLSERGGGFYWDQYEYADLTLTIEEVLSLSLSTTAIDIGVADGAGYWQADEAFEVTAGGNIAFDVTLRADHTHFLSGSGLNDDAKPITELEWSDGDSWTPLSMEAATIASNVPPGAPDLVSTVNIRANVTGNEPNDQYIAHFTFEAIAQ